MNYQKYRSVKKILENTSTLLPDPNLTQTQLATLYSFQYPTRWALVGHGLPGASFVPLSCVWMFGLSFTFGWSELCLVCLVFATLESFSVLYKKQLELTCGGEGAKLGKLMPG